MGQGLDYRPMGNKTTAEAKESQAGSLCYVDKPSGLRLRCAEGLDGVSAAELQRLFPWPSITAGLLSLLCESGIDGFKLRSIVVSKDGAAILLLPLFETRFDLSTFVDGRLKILLKTAGRLMPMLFRPRILGVGLLIGEWSEIGIDPGIDAGTLDAAFQMAFGTLQTLAGELKSDFVALYNFSQYSKLPEQAAKQFNRVPCQSCAQLPIDFNSVEEFLARLSKAARKDLHRKMRTGHDVKIVRSRDISGFSDRIYKLYLDTVARSPLTFGVLKPLFFEKICEHVPEAEYTLYFVQGKLVAFNLLVVQKEAMVDKYFCMDYEIGRTYNLYALSWLENIRRCAELKIPVYQAGQGAENTKAHLGATFVPSFIYFRHRRPMIDRFILLLPEMNRGIARSIGVWPKASDAAADGREDLAPKRAERNNFKTITP